MRHVGVCVPRQYASFAGIANGGRRCNAFFDKLVRRGYARQIRCRPQPRAGLSRPSQAAVFRHRRSVEPVPPAGVAAPCGRAPDAARRRPRHGRRRVADHGSREGRLLRGAERQRHAATPPSPSANAAPTTAPPLPSAFPVGVAADGRTVLVYLACEPDHREVRGFLQTHAALLRVAPSWTIRIVFPRPLDHAYDAYQAVIHEELESPLHSATIGELQWYFEHRLEARRGEPMHPMTQGFLRNGARGVRGGPVHRDVSALAEARKGCLRGPVVTRDRRGIEQRPRRVESVVLPHRIPPSRSPGG